MMVRDLMIKMMFTLSDESIMQKFSCLKKQWPTLLCSSNIYQDINYLFCEFISLNILNFELMLFFSVNNLYD